MAKEFVEAVREGNAAKVRAMLAEDPTLASAIDPRFQEPVLFSTSDPKVAELLIAYGADVNARGDEDRTALINLAKCCVSGPIPALIAHGADLDAKDVSGRTALNYAISCFTSDGSQIIDLLLRAGAYYDLHTAAARGDIRRVKELVEECSNPFDKMSLIDLEDLLMWAIRKSCQPGGDIGTMQERKEIVRILFSHGFPIEKQKLENLVDQYFSDGLHMTELIQE
jgi:ankyrin repeat protein